MDGGNERNKNISQGENYMEFKLLSQSTMCHRDTATLVDLGFAVEALRWSGSAQ